MKKNSLLNKIHALRGEVLTFINDPFNTNIGKDCYLHYKDGMVVIQDGIIIDVDNYQNIYKKYNDIDIEIYSDAVILPGFIDCHVHYVQSPMIGSYGGTLLEWLNNCTYPTEAKFNNKSFADEVASVFFKQILQQGTTTANVFSTTFATSVDAFFEESERYNTRMITGKVLQDRNLPESLKDESAEESIRISEQLLKKWHHRGRQLYAIIPRFAATSTEKQMELAGKLYQRYIDQGVYLHTHLNEAPDEIEWISQLYPDQKNCTDVYKKYQMVDNRTVMAHTCLMSEEEWQDLHDAGVGCAHCPSSNLFLADGQFKFWEAKKKERPVHIGIGTDVGAGTNFSIIRQLNEAYKVGMLQTKQLTTLQSFYLATRGGAEALHLEGIIGTLQPGYEADIAILDLKATDFVAWRMQFADSIFDKLFILQTLALDNMVKATYVSGKKVFDRSRSEPFMYSSNTELNKKGS